jgi:hypothetical protein
MQFVIQRNDPPRNLPALKALFELLGMMLGCHLGQGRAGAEPATGGRQDSQAYRHGRLNHE